MENKIMETYLVIVYDKEKQEYINEKCCSMLNCFSFINMFVNPEHLNFQRIVYLENNSTMIHDDKDYNITIHINNVH